jgi:hypothetical protein
MRTIRRLWPLLFAVMLLCSCALGTQIKKTRINLQHPSGPFFGPYTVEISSKSYTGKLTCSFGPDGKHGQVLDANAKSPSQPVGVCDTQSMTLDNVGLAEAITLSLTQGGYAFIDKVSKHPTRFEDLTGAEACLGCKQSVFDFSYAGLPR